MRKNKDLVYEFIQKEELLGESDKKGLMTNDIADKLGMQRTNVSAILNELTKEGKLIKTKTRPVYYVLPKAEETGREQLAFENMVGYDGSLRKAIQQAKAAILYPGSNLNIQLISHSGSGITHFGREIYQFVLEKKLLNRDAPYIYVNCRYYIKNINVLNEVLFGDISGIENSCFARAQGGFLFVDNAHLLDAKQYSRICRYLETGDVYAESENKILDCSDCFFVFATAMEEENQPEWKNSIVVEIPTLEERPMSEKMELIELFFKEEAATSSCQIEVTSEAVRALLAIRFTGGIKELCVAIKSACANAYIRVLDEAAEGMRVCLSDFDEKIQRGLLLYRSRCSEIDELLGTANFMRYGGKETAEEVKNGYPWVEVYDNIKDQYRELTERGLSNVSVKGVIEAYIGSLLKMVPDREKEDGELNLEQLSKTVDVRIINLVSIFSQRYKNEFGRELPTNAFFGLCLHLNAMLTMKSIERKRISDEQVRKIIQDYPREYAAAFDFAKVLEEKLHLVMNIEETVLLVMFIIEPEKNASHPVVLYAMHGRGVAKYLAETTNKLTQEKNTYAYDMDLSMDTRKAMEELEEIIVTIDEGGGVIVIYDMGSFGTMLDMIAERTNIKIRGINMPVTTAGVEVARRCARESDIDRIYHLVNQEIQQIIYPKEQWKKLIITLCHTAEGGATQLKQYIDQYSKLNMRTIALAVADKDKLIQEVMELKKNYEIHAFVGTFDPELFGIPFIPISDIFESEKIDIDRVLMFEPVNKTRVGYDEVIANFENELHYVSADKLRKILPGCVEELAAVYHLQENEKIGFFAHMVSLLEYLASPDYICKNNGAETIVAQRKEDYLFVSKVLKRLERQFKVIINDAEMGIILQTLTRENKIA